MSAAGDATIPHVTVLIHGSLRRFLFPPFCSLYPYFSFYSPSCCLHSTPTPSETLHVTSTVRCGPAAIHAQSPPPLVGYFARPQRTHLPGLALTGPCWLTPCPTTKLFYSIPPSTPHTIFNQKPASEARRAALCLLTAPSRSNWVCKRCLAGHLGLAKRRHYYHDNLPLLSRAASPNSASPGLGDASVALKLKLNAASMAATAATAIASDPGQQHQHSDAAGFIINCSFTGCPAKIDGKRQVLCEAHLQVISKTDGQTRDPGPVRANGMHGTRATPTSAGPTSPRNPRKLLPETDKDRPIMRRKTAGNPPQFITQQPTPKHSAPSSRGESAMSPPSQPRALAPRPSVRSPPASPGSLQDGEPLRKRQRRSSSPRRSPEKAKVNGTALSSNPPSTTESFDKAAESASPRSSRRVLHHSPQRPGSVREKDIKPPSKLSYRHPVRRMPLQLSNLRFIDGPGESMQGVLSEQSSSGVNGSAGHVPRRTSGASDSSQNGAIRDYWAKKLETSNPAPPAARPATDSTRHTRRRSELPNGQHQKTLPERRKSVAQSPYGPFQANETTSSKPPRIHIPIKPALITKPVQRPPPKEIDTARFDALIYAQEGASSPPPDIDLTLTPLPKKPAELPDPLPSHHQPQPEEPPQKDEPLYLPIDPRTHWPQPHSASWHAAKQAEIQARGRKKANFGRAVESLRRQNLQLQQQGEEHPEEVGLPEKILENPAWVRALRRLRGEAVEGLREGGGGSAEGSGAEGPGGGDKRGRRQNGVVGKRVGNSGVVVVSGLSGAQMGVGRREGS